jgi:ribosomal protein L44E
MINNGIRNEYIYVNYLNRKTVGELNPLMQDLIYKIFNNINEKDLIYAKRNPGKEKADIIITIGKQKRNISLKIGDKNSVHLEPISEFIHFLIENNLPRQAIIKYLEFQYADGTRNGTGTNRLSVEEYKKTKQEDINYLNEQFKNKKFIDKCIERFILKGREKNFKKIDAIVTGKICDFFYITEQEIKEIIYKYIDIETTGLHIGPLFIQPQSRNLNYNKKYETCRYNVQIKWFNLSDQILLYKNDLVMKQKNTQDISKL